MDSDVALVNEGDDFIELSCGTTYWTDRNGFQLMQKDYRVGGEVWRVHKSDPDPLPSRPHAHCVGGRRKFVGCKLHLGTRELFSSDNKPMEEFLSRKQFNMLIERVRTKFPEIVLPLEA